MIAVPRPSVASTMIGPSAFGRISRKRMRASDGAERAGREHVGLLAQHERRGAHDPRIFGPDDDDEGERDVDDARPENGDDRERQDQRRKAEEDVGDAHQQEVDPAAEIAGDEADRRADRRGDRDGEARRSRARCGRRRSCGSRGRGRSCRCRASGAPKARQKRLRMSICSTPWVAKSGARTAQSTIAKRDERADDERGDCGARCGRRMRLTRAGRADRPPRRGGRRRGSRARTSARRSARFPGSAAGRAARSPRW